MQAVERELAREAVAHWREETRRCVSLAVVSALGALCFAATLRRMHERVVGREPRDRRATRARPVNARAQRFARRLSRTRGARVAAAILPRLGSVDKVAEHCDAKAVEDLALCASELERVPARAKWLHSIASVARIQSFSSLSLVAHVHVEVAVQWRRTSSVCLCRRSASVDQSDTTAPFSALAWCGEHAVIGTPCGKQKSATAPSGAPLPGF